MIVMLMTMMTMMINDDDYDVDNGGDKLMIIIVW